MYTYILKNRVVSGAILFFTRLEGHHRGAFVIFAGRGRTFLACAARVSRRVSMRFTSTKRAPGNVTLCVSAQILHSPFRADVPRRPGSPVKSTGCVAPHPSGLLSIQPP